MTGGTAAAFGRLAEVNRDCAQCGHALQEREAGAGLGELNAQVRVSSLSSHLAWDPSALSRASACSRSLSSTACACVGVAGLFGDVFAGDVFGHDGAELGDGGKKRLKLGFRDFDDQLPRLPPVGVR